VNLDLVNRPIGGRMQPLKPTKRIEAVDVLRGVAILGIFCINMLSYAGNFTAPSAQASSLDRAVVWILRFVAQAKFYTLFSFLFGWGMAIQMERARQKNVPFVPYYLRRMLSLLIIGLVHAILVWDGDILVTYALLGLFLLCFHKASDRVLLVAGGVCILIPVFLSLPGPVATFREWYATLRDPLRSAIAVGHQNNVLAQGSYLEAVAHRWRTLLYSYTNIIYWGPHVFGMFLWGVYAGRQKICRQPSTHTGLLRRVLWGGILVGLPLNLLFMAVTDAPHRVPAIWYDLATRGARTLAGSSLSLVYAVIIVRLAQNPRWHARLSPLTSVGRMGLSNYLTQSVLCTLIFYGYGLGLYGRVGATAAFLLMLIIYRLQIAASEWWLRRFRYGPVEWLWRTMTYGRRIPMRGSALAVTRPLAPPATAQTPRSPWKDWLSFLGSRLAFILAVSFAIVYFCFLGVGLVSNSRLPLNRSRTVWQQAGPALDDTTEFWEVLFQGNLGDIVEGVTQRQRIPITEAVANAALQSGYVLIVAIGVATLVGVTAGGIAATRQYSPLSLGTLTLTVVGVSIPSFFLALLIQVADIKFYQRTGSGLFPVFGMAGQQRTTALLPQVIAPALVLAARPLAHITRVTFTTISDVLNRDFIRTARAKGLPSRTVYWRHALRNAGVSILTALVISLRFALGSLPVVEIFFSWPGLGVMMLNGIFEHNATLVVMPALILGGTFMIVTLLADTAYRFIDPRLRTSVNGNGSET